MACYLRSLNLLLEALMASRCLLNLILISFICTISCSSYAHASLYNTSHPYPKAISDLKEVIVRGLGFQSDDVQVTGFDARDALIGHSASFEFDVEIDNKLVPVKLLEDVNRWEYVDLSIFRDEEENSLVEEPKLRDRFPVLAPFQLAGPMEIWITDAENMRISLPHDVDAGMLKKIVLADGAVVTIKGARSVSLRRPVALPLPLNRTQSGFASGLLAMAQRLRHSYTTHQAPLLSLRIVGPTSLSSPSSSSSSPNKLKLKRLAPGQVELSPPPRSQPTPTVPLLVSQEEPSTATLLTPNHLSTLWPLASINGSNSNLVGFEKLLASMLATKPREQGGFLRLLKADVYAQTSVKIGFGIEKKIGDGDGLHSDGIPSWRTKPDVVKLRFEVIGKVDGDQIVPERIMQVTPIIVEDSVAPSVVFGNASLSSMPVFYHPSPYFSL